MIEAPPPVGVMPQALDDEHGEESPTDVKQVESAGSPGPGGLDLPPDLENLEMTGAPAPIPAPPKLDFGPPRSPKRGNTPPPARSPVESLTGAPPVRPPLELDDTPTTPILRPAPRARPAAVPTPDAAASDVVEQPTTTAPGEESDREIPISKSMKRKPPSTSPQRRRTSSPPRAGRAPPTPPKRTRSLLGRLVRLTALLAFVSVVSAIVGYFGVTWYYGRELPSIDTLRAYHPATVTVVTDRNGEVLGEIFEQRRYVVPLDDIPAHVQQAFLSAEDAGFYSHGGVDYVGIIGALWRAAKAGGIEGGASTITMQVTRNFLLTRDKKLERKIKEIILTWRIEDAYTKDHILFLYLNEIYLGSQSYGVEAASRAYYGKHVQDVTIAEAAILAGLPQRPSDYSPHKHFEKAKGRQKYVLRQMLANGFIDQAQHDAALIEPITIEPRGNTFLEEAPHFTEYVRRYLVDRYGEDRVLNEGLQVTTTCDLDLQRHAQAEVVAGVHRVDQRMGFRREGLENIAADQIEARRAAVEQELRQEWAGEQDPAGRVEMPDRSVLTPGRTYTGVITEVSKSWAKVGIGAHTAVIPIAWSTWVYDPNPKRSWRNRSQGDLLEKVDGDDDGVAEGSILRMGDVVLTKVEGLDTKDEAFGTDFQKTPGADESFVAARLWQNPEVEASLLSMDVTTGAVRAMVGGSDFTESQFNRAVQAYRQVGSTFKPIVYAAALQTGKVHTATVVTDAPLAFATDNDFVWKPSNYGEDYLGNITLRKALALSRNTCTVRVLEGLDPGMNDDVVYSFARKLGIGGIPSHLLPEDRIATPDNDHLCPWIRETSESTICMDRYPAIEEGITNTAHRRQLKPEDEYWCRACDMSMALGSPSLTMEELVRAYAVFANDGAFVQPYYVEEVRDRNGDVLEHNEPEPPVQIIETEIASLTRWLLTQVVNSGTGFKARQELQINIAGKTGTTNDEKDTWFVGFSPDVITAVWVGFDQPRSLGVSSTGGRTAMPIWIEYMRKAAPKDKDRPFELRGDIEWAYIDDDTGRRVSSGGRKYPFLRGTTPESTGLEAGQITIEDITGL